MKFVTGLLLGGLATLFVATVLGMDWEQPSRLDSDAFSEFAVVEPSTQTSAAIESPADSVAIPAPVKSVTIEPLAALPPPPTPERSPAVAPDPVIAPTPVAAVPDEHRVVEQPPKQTFAPANESREHQQPLLAPQLIVDRTDPVVSATPGTRAETAVIWKPFHSSVSAAGFARRLSTQLGYPFRSLREGPAKYHVVFDYESDAQRELLKEQVKALTGFSVI